MSNQNFQQRQQGPGCVIGTLKLIGTFIAGVAGVVACLATLVGVPEVRLALGLDHPTPTYANLQPLQPTSTPQPYIAPQPTSVPLPTITPWPTQRIVTPTLSFTPVGSARLSWTGEGITYVAVLQASGSTGLIDVNFYDPNYMMNVTVREDLQLQNYQGTWIYMGSNPRYVPSGLAANYAPDAFRLDIVAGGQWMVTATCDSQNRCAYVLQQ